MSTTPPSDRRADDSRPTPEAGATTYEKPALIEYGPLAKITQGLAGSTGETGNFTMRMCL